MPAVLRFALYCLGLVIAGWLLLQAAHELGHVLGTWYGGGRVERVVWHPLTVSRTDRVDVARPLPATAGGVVVGTLLPLALWLALCRSRAGRELRFFAGFCLVANGAYLVAGTPLCAGDAGDLLILGLPPWLLLGAGFAAGVAGLWLWWDLGRLLGWRRESRPSWPRAGLAVAVAAVVLAAAWLLGSPA